VKEGDSGAAATLFKRVPHAAIPGISCFLYKNLKLFQPRACKWQADRNGTSLTKGFSMKNKLIYPLVVIVLAACGGDGEGGKKVAGQQYETVQEGSAAGVTSSIAGPGETLPPITNTNADTTSAFALNPSAAPAAAPAEQQSSAMAGTMPQSQPAYSGGASPSYNPAPSYNAPQGSASPAPQRQAYVPPMTSSSRPAPAPRYQPAPSRTEPAPQPPAQSEEPAATGPAPSDSADAPQPTTNTAPAPQPQQQEEPAEAEDEQEAPAEEPPPPPPPAR
jgi:hypothetical protein